MTEMIWIFIGEPFRVRGDVVEIFPANESELAIRVEFFGDEIDRITQIDVLTGEIKCELNHAAVFPASHYVVPMEQILKAAEAIEEEMEEQVRYFKGEDKLIEAQRIAERTNFDVEMMKETGSAPELKIIPGICPVLSRDSRRIRFWITSGMISL